MSFGCGVGGFLKRTNYKQSKLAMMIKLSSDSIEKVQSDAAAFSDENESEKISSSEDDGVSLEKLIPNAEKCNVEKVNTPMLSMV